MLRSRQTVFSVFWSDCNVEQRAWHQQCAVVNKQCAEDNKTTNSKVFARHWEEEKRKGRRGLLCSSGLVELVPFQEGEASEVNKLFLDILIVKLLRVHLVSEFTWRNSFIEADGPAPVEPLTLNKRCKKKIINTNIWNITFCQLTVKQTWDVTTR